MSPNSPPKVASTPTSSGTSLDPNDMFYIDSCSTLHGPGHPGACRVLMVLAHPSPRASRINIRLAEAAAQIDGVWVNDLYETYPDFYVDMARERTLVAGAHALVLVFPTEWYAAPALMKEWIDIVLGDAWRRDRFTKRGLTDAQAALRCWVVTSTGGAAEDFAAGRRHGRPFNDYMAPFEQMARVCGMQWLEPLVLYSAHDIDRTTVDAHVTRFTAELQSLTKVVDLTSGSRAGAEAAMVSGEYARGI